MGRRTETRRIDGVEVSTTQLPVLRALALATRLARIASPAAGALAPLLLRIGSEPESDKAAAARSTFVRLMTTDTSVLGTALATLFAEIDPQTAQALARETLCCTVAVVEGRRVDCDSDATINAAFNDLRSLCEAVAFALEVNFSSFFGGARNSTGGA